MTAMTMLKQYLYRSVPPSLCDTPAYTPNPLPMSRYQGHVGAYLVIGGVDDTGAHLFTVHAHGSTDKLPYVTMGSGSMAAMAVFESGYKEDLTVRCIPRPVPAESCADMGAHFLA